MLDPDFVQTIHDEIIKETGGLKGFAGGGRGGLEAALFRIDNHVEYEGLDDIYEIAALYAEAIACGHVFQRWQQANSIDLRLDILGAPRCLNTPRATASECNGHARRERD